MKQEIFSLRCILLGAASLWRVVLPLAMPMVLHAQLTYTTTEGTVTITGYQGAGELNIPDAMFGVPVTRIGDSAFKSNAGLTSVTMGDKITYLGTGAFEKCLNLTNVVIGNGLKYVGDRAFVECRNLTHVDLGKSITGIGSSSFYFCTALTSVSIPDSVSDILSSAFDTCVGMTNVAFGKGLGWIGTNAFASCTGISEIALGEKVTNIQDTAFENCRGLTKVTFGSSVARIGQGAFRGCPNLVALYFNGKPPEDRGAFAGDIHVVAYYFPQATGWGPTFGGYPTVLWDCQLATTKGSFGIQTNNFGLTITGTSSLVAVVEACTNLLNPTWIPVSSNTLGGPVANGFSYFVDPQWTNSASRFYRIRPQ